MIALFLSPLYLIGNVYICCRALQWLSVCSHYLQIRVSAVLYNHLRIFGLIHWPGFYPAPFRVSESSGLHWHLLAWNSPIHNYHPGCCRTDSADFTYYPHRPLRNSHRQKNFYRYRFDLYCCNCIFLYMGYHQRCPRSQYEL